MKTVVVREKVVRERGIGFLGLLTIVLVILKAVGYLEDVSWLWVFSPIWIPIAIVLIFILIMVVIYVFLYGFFKLREAF